jgi:hypothetical protein
MRRRQIEPAPDRIRRGCSVKGGIDFNRRKVPGIEFQPMWLWQIRRIENIPPFFEAPGAGSDTNLLLVVKIQSNSSYVRGNEGKATKVVQKSGAGEHVLFGLRYP